MKTKGKKNLTYTQRLKLEQCFNAGLKKTEIAKKLGVCLATVYNELNRGKYEHKVIAYNKFWYGKKYKTIQKYSPEKAQEKYNLNMTAKGVPLKIGNDYAFVQYVEKRIIQDKLSPCAVAGEIKRNKLFNTVISKTTMYRYISLGLFENIKMKNLPLKERKKHHRKTVAKRAPKGVSIEYRPLEIKKRNEFGHWEMDCVVGKQRTKDTLLTFTERLTRYEIIFRIPNRKSLTVVSCLDSLERKYGKRFKQIFKSVTVDNGAEFSDFMGLEKSIYGGKRLSLFYCHPYCSSERGSNERLNREVRRHFPKGTSFSNVTNKKVQFVADWINNYPREIFGYETSAERFNLELKKIA